jgi:TetR/AcrR family acrAB operon transcriptional repressor
MRRTKEEADITRTKLLAAALQVFSQNGYAATRLEDIAQAAQVTRGAIYHHFGSKENLYIELVHHYEAGINQVAQDIIDEGGPPRTILKRLLVRLFEYLEDDDDYRAVVELFINKVEITKELEEITRQMILGRRILVRFFTDLLKQGVEAGEFRADLPVDDAARALAGFINGMGLLWVQDPKSFSIRESAQSLVNVFLEGVIEYG